MTFLFVALYGGWQRQCYKKIVWVELFVIIFDFLTRFHQNFVISPFDIFANSVHQRIGSSLQRENRTVSTFEIHFVFMGFKKNFQSKIAALLIETVQFKANLLFLLTTFIGGLKYN